MKKKLITLVVILTALSSSITACNSSKSIEDYNAYLIASIEKENIETYLYRDSAKIYEVDNEKNIINEYTTSVDDDVGHYKDLLKLSNTTEYIDIELVTNKVESLGDYVFYTDIEQSTKYINFMRESGYKEVFKMCTPDFIELILTDNTGTRRVIITSENMILAKVDGYSFNIEDYIKSENLKQ